MLFIVHVALPGTTLPSFRSVGKLTMVVVAVQVGLKAPNLIVLGNNCNILGVRKWHPLECCACVIQNPHALLPILGSVWLVDPLNRAICVPGLVTGLVGMLVVVIVGAATCRSLINP